jgi:hypothetical protein
MDLLAYGSPSLDNIKSTFQAAAALAADDGMIFLPETVQTAEIREDAFNSGIRVTMEGRLGKASVPCRSTSDLATTSRPRLPRRSSPR